MPGIKFDFIGDDTGFVRTAEHVQETMRKTAKTIRDFAKRGFDMSGLANQMLTLTSEIRTLDESIMQSKVKIATWSAELQKALSDSNFSLINTLQKDIDKENAALDKQIKQVEEYKDALRSLAEMRGYLTDAKAPMLFNSQEEYDQIERLKGQIATLQQAISSFKGDDKDLMGMRENLSRLNAELQRNEVAAANNAAKYGTVGAAAATMTTRYYELTNAIKEQEQSVLKLRAEYHQALLEKNKLIKEGASAGDIEEATVKFDSLGNSLAGVEKHLANLRIEQDKFSKNFQSFSKQPSIGSSEVRHINYNRDEVDNFKEGIEAASAAGEYLGDVLKGVGALVGISFGVGQITSFVKKVMDTREYFQDIESSMKVFLGDQEKAADFTKKLKDYAFYNMFEFSDLAKASQQMIAYRHEVDTIIPRLDELSNVATGTHAPLMELVNSYNKAKSTGIVDGRDIQSWAVKGVMIKDTLKEIGEQVNGTTVTFEQLNKVLDHITGEGGMFHNLMGEMMENISADKGQLEDNLASMFNEIGEKYQDIIDRGYKLAGEMVENYSELSGGIIDAALPVVDATVTGLEEHYKDLASVLGNLIAIYGAWKVAILAVDAIKQVDIVLTQAQERAEMQNALARMKVIPAIGQEVVMTEADMASKGKATVATALLDAAQEKLNATFLANPYTWVAAALSALVFFTFKAITAESGVEEGTRKANEELTRQGEILEERKSKVESLIRTLQDENATNLAKLKAYKELQEVAPNITDAYKQEELSVLSLDKTQKLLNNDLDATQFKEAKGKVEEYTKRVESLKNALDGYRNSQATSSYSLGRGDVLARQLEKAEAELDVYKKKLHELESLQEEAIENARPVEVRLEEAQGNMAVKTELFNFFEGLGVAAEEVQDANGNINYEQAIELTDEYIGYVQNEFADLKKKLSEDPNDVKIRMALDNKYKVLEELQNFKKELETNSSTYIPLTVFIDWKVKSASKDVEDEKAAMEELGYKWVQSFAEVSGGHWEKEVKETEKSIKQIRKEQKKAYNDAAADLKAFQNGTGEYANKTYTDDEYKKVLKQKQDALSEAKKYVDKEDKKAAKDLRNRQVKRIQEEHKYQDELAKIQKQGADAREDANIAAIKNNSERERAERRVQHERTLRDLQAQTDDIYKAIYDQRKKSWETTHKDSPYELADGGNGWKGVEGTLTEEETSYFNQRYAVIQAEKDKENAVWTKYIDDITKKQLQSLNDYIKEYGTIQQQKLALAREYDDKIEEESDIARKAALQKEYESKVEELNFKELQDSLDWEQVFGDISKYSVSMLRSLKEKLKTALDAKDITAENAKVLVEKIREIEDSITDRTDVWSSMLPALRERKRLAGEILEIETEINKLQNNYDVNVQKVDELRQGIAESVSTISGDTKGNVLQKLFELDFDPKEVMGFYDIQDESGELADQFAALIVATTNLAKSEQQLTSAQKAKKAIDELINGKKGIGEALSTIFNTTGKGFTEIFSTVASNAQSMATFVDKIGAGESDFGQAVHSFADGVGGFNSALSSLAQGDVFGALNGVIDGIDSIGNIFGLELFSGSEKNFENAVKKWGWLLDSWQDNLNYERKLIEEAYGADAINLKNKAEQELRDAQKAAAEVYHGWASSGKSLTSRSHGYEANENADWQALLDKNLELAKQVGVEIWKNPLNNQEIARGGNIGRLFDLTGSQLKELSQTNRQFWQSLDETARKYLEEVIQIEDEIENLNIDVKEQITSISFDSLYDSFLSTLMKMDSSAEDFASDFEGYMQKAVMSLMMGEVIKPMLKEWYDQFFRAAESGGGLTPNEVNALYDGSGEIKSSEEIIEERLGDVADNIVTHIKDAIKRLNGESGEDTGEVEEQRLGRITDNVVKSIEDVMQSLDDNTASIDESTKEEREQTRRGGQVKTLPTLQDIDSGGSGVSGGGVSDTTAPQVQQVEEETKDAFTAWQDIVNYALNERDKLMAAFGWSAEDEYKQSAGAKGYQTMSQDTAEVMNGRLTAIQIATEHIRMTTDDTMGTVASILATLQGGISIITANDNNLNEIRNLAVTRNAYLDDMARYTKKMYQEWTTKIDELNTNIKAI